MYREPWEHLIEIFRPRGTSPQARDGFLERTGIVELAALRAARGIHHGVRGASTHTLRRQGRGRPCIIWYRCSLTAEIDG